MNVLCVETGMVYISTTHAAENKRGKQSTISQCCRGIKKTSGGLHWRWTDKPVTGTRICACGKEYIPTKESPSFCCRACRNEAYKDAGMKKGERAERMRIQKTGFSFDDDIMIVQNNERHGNIYRVADAGLGFDVAALESRRSELILSGQYDLIKKMLGIQSTLCHSGARIA